MILRSFIAIEIPRLIQEVIFKLTANIRQEYPIPGIRWVPVQNIHLTLKFLGEVPSQNLELLAQSLAFEINPLEPFANPFSETGVFPNTKKPRIIWLGFKFMQELVELNNIIETTSSKLGFQTEERPFSPHITLGRIGEKFSPIRFTNLLSDLRALDISCIDPVIIDSIKIFKSDLRPKGPEYTILHTIPFVEADSKEEYTKHA